MELSLKIGVKKLCRLRFHGSFCKNNAFRERRSSVIRQA